MKVAIVSPYALNVPGGVQGQVIGLALALSARDVEVGVVHPGDVSPQLSANIAAFPVGKTIAVRANGSIAPIAFQPQAFVRTRRALVRFDPDLVHVHEPAVPGPALASIIGHIRPIVATFHRSGASAGYRLAGIALAKVFRGIDDVVAVSEAARQTLDEVMGRRHPPSVIIENGVDFARFNSSDKVDHSEVVIVFVGRHEPRKGLPILLEAFCATAIRARLWIIGTGPQTGTLQRRFCDDRIVWWGRVDDQELARLVRTADIFVAPALSGESYGVVLLEAMSAQTAVIASGLPGYRLAGGTVAQYVPPGDAHALKAALEHLYRDGPERTRLAAEGVDRARSHDFACVAEQYLERYARVLEVSS